MTVDSAAERHLPTGTVTFLFTDIEGSTELLVRLGDDYEPLLAEHARILRDAVASHGGSEVNTEGDAFFVAFPSATEAVAATTEAQRALAAHDWPPDAEIRVRMGMHTGTGKLGGDDYAGLDVNRAARIASAAHGGQVIISGATHALVQNDMPAGVALRSMGSHRLKDLPETVEMWQLDIDGLATEFPPLKTLDARATNLSADLRPLVGRELELSEIRELMADRRLITLTGPGGTGKTRLSQAVAAASLDDFADGVFFVELEASTDRAGVVSDIASAIGIREHTDRDLESSVRSYLSDREILLVMDNYEQAMDAVDLIPDLLDASPKSRILVTSRIVLRLSAEQEYPVDTLTLPDPNSRDLEAIAANPAVALFLARATELRPSFELTADNASDIAAICARLDGLPLAIELAAARTRLLKPAALLKRLETALPMLTSGDRDRPARQQTLAGAIDWSYELLDDDERRLLSCLSVFSGGWTLEAAEHVCTPTIGPGIDTLDGLTSLVEKSLVRMTDEDDEPRFGLLGIIREYAAERAAADPGMASIGRQHAEWVADLVETAEPELRLGSMGEWQRRLLAEEDNIRAALRWAIDAGETETAARIAGSLWRFWHFWGHVREGTVWLEQVAALPASDLPPGTAAKVQSGLGSMYYWVSASDRAEAAYMEALRLLESGDDAVAIADARYDTAWSAIVAGQADLGRERMERATEAYRAAGDEGGLATAEHARAVLGAMAFEDRTYEQAVDVSLAAEATLRRLDRLHDAIGVEASLIGLHLQGGRHDLAYAVAQRVVHSALELGEVGRFGGMLPAAASLELALGRPERAVMLASAIERHADELGGTLSLSFTGNTALDDAREQLDAATYAAAVETGRTMSIREAAEFLLQGEPPD